MLKNNPYFGAFKGIGLLIRLVMALSMANAAQAATTLQNIEVIFNNQTAGIKNTLQGLSSQGISIDFYNLDLPAQVNRELSQGLPMNLEAAKKIVQERLHSQGSAALSQRYQMAYQALIKSINYGLDRYPAIVFNKGQAVIYGVTDLKSALQTYKNWSITQ